MSCTFKGVTLTWELWKKAYSLDTFIPLPTLPYYSLIATTRLSEEMGELKWRPRFIIVDKTPYRYGERSYNRGVVGVDWEEFAKLNTDKEIGVRIR